MNLTNKVEAIGATAAGAVSLSSCLTDANGYLQLAIGVATLAWWVRLWWKNPNVKPPQ